MDKQIKQMNEFTKNVLVSDELGKKFRGNFIAIYKQKVLGWSKEYKELWDMIKSYHNEPELYVTYIPRSDEIIVL